MTPAERQEAERRQLDEFLRRARAATAQAEAARRFAGPDPTADPAS